MLNDETRDHTCTSRGLVRARCSTGRYRALPTMPPPAGLSSIVNAHRHRRTSCPQATGRLLSRGLHEWQPRRRPPATNSSCGAGAARRRSTRGAFRSARRRIHAALWGVRRRDPRPRIVWMSSHRRTRRPFVYARRPSRQSTTSRSSCIRNGSSARKSPVPMADLPVCGASASHVTIPLRAQEFRCARGACRTGSRHPA